MAKSETVSGPLKICRYELHRPSLDEIANLFRQTLGQHYEQSSVELVDCPDLKKEPFYLADKGLGGSPAIADVGGVPYLVPLAQTDRPPYSLADITRQISYEKAFYVGASAGPFHIVGTNSELMPNCLVKSTPKSSELEVNSQTHCTKLNESNGKGYETFKLDDKCDSFCLLGNLFLSQGLPGKVIKITAKVRKSNPGTDGNFITNLRNILNKQFNKNNGKQVSLGGVFLIKSGKVKVHVMPAFSQVPLCSDDEVNSWLKYFEVSSPLVALTVFHSYDAGQDLRIEHTHCFSKHGDGGHYHYDTTADQVEYEGYFNIAENIYRVDAPVETHNIGRD